MLDVYLGLDSLTYDKDVERRELYGKAGAFRPKEYGVEYRVLSNAWLISPLLMGRVYDITVLTTDIYRQGARLPREMCEAAAQCINTSDESTAAEILQQAKTMFGLE